MLLGNVLALSVKACRLCQIPPFVTAGDKRGNLARERLRGRASPGKVASRSDDERGVLRLHFYVLHKQRILSM